MKMKEEIISYIIKSKDLLYREENIQKYIDIIQNKVYIKNPFDRAIAAIFELVIEREIDPCQIDLIKFSKLYFEKIKEDINLFVAGKILFMAWKILRLQSEEILRNMERKEEMEEIEIPEWYGEDEAFDYTIKVMGNELPFEKKIRRMPSRKITLVELINAFEEAKEKLKKKKKVKASWTGNIVEHTHKEDIENDIKRVMEKLSKLNGEAIPLKKLYNGKDEMLSILLPLLFLAKEGKIAIWQDNFPFGEIYVKLNHD